MTTEERLYKRLPAWHRQHDAEQGETLRGLMGILDEIRRKIHDDIGNLHDNWFIETCDEWVIPYIADLLGVDINHSVSSAGVFNQRPFVGRTIHYRRRKGTVAVLENIAKDVSGWPVKAVEFFQHMGWTQHLNHLRMEQAPNPYPYGSGYLNPASQHRVGTVNIRDLDGCDRIDGPFNNVSHTFDMRPMGQLNGYFCLKKIGLFVWRLNAWSLRGLSPRQSTVYPDGYHFDPAGVPRKLFTNPRVQPDNDAPQDELSVPAPVRCTAFWKDLDAYYGNGPDAGCAVYDNGTIIESDRIICKDLTAWDPPPPGMVALDPVLGRCAFAHGESPEILSVDYTHGFGVNAGGGPYDRRDSLIQPILTDYAVSVAQDGSGDFTSLTSALAGWDQTTHPRAVLTIQDNGTYKEPLSISLQGRVRLVIQASNRCRPHIQPIDESLNPDVIRFTGGTGTNAAAEFDGLYIEGGVHTDAESCRDLTFRHTTLIPGRAIQEDGNPLDPHGISIVMAPDAVEHEITLVRSISGPIIMEENGGRICAVESILDHPDAGFVIAGLPDGTAAGPDLEVTTCTIKGEVRVRQILLASDTLFKDTVTVQRKQVGCMRYCYIDERESITPRRFRCQPEYTVLEKRKRPDGLSSEAEQLIRNQTIPVFTSRQYGKAGYCQPALPTGDALAMGSEDGNEIGVFNIQKQAFRAKNIEQRTHEYAPFQMKPGIIYLT